jgi:hypothetical protein
VVDLIYALYTGGPTAFTELLLVDALWFFRGRGAWLVHCGAYKNNTDRSLEGLQKKP